MHKKKIETKVTVMIDETKEEKCCLCGDEVRLGGCNPQPLGEMYDDVCCHSCDGEYVQPARGLAYRNSKDCEIWHVCGNHITKAREGAMGISLGDRCHVCVERSEFELYEV